VSAGAFPPRMRIPPHSCRAMIVLAGMPRTGSTLQGQFVQAALRTFNCPVGATGYWDILAHKGIGNPLVLEQYYDRLYAKWAQLKSSQCVVSKSHEYESAMTSFCNHTVVITSHRCLDDEVRSAVGIRLGGIVITERSIEDFLKSWIEWYHSWKAYGAIDFDYSTMVSDPNGTVRVLAQYMAMRLNNTTLEASTIPSMPPLALASSGSSSSRLNDSQTSRLHDVLQRVRSNLAGSWWDPHHHDLSWCDSPRNVTSARRSIRILHSRRK
jgi:hypothetical protein